MKSPKFVWNNVASSVTTGFNKISAVVVVICFFLAACTLVRLNKEVKESLASTIIVGHISAPFHENGPIVVAAYSLNKGKREIAHYTVLHDIGEYELLVGEGSYYVCAYWDKNSNLIYDSGEPAGQYGEPKSIATPAGGVVLNIDIAIPEKESKIDLPDGFKIASVLPEKLHSRIAGAIMDFDDELFSDENGIKGFWEPLDFFKEIGGNIYFLEEYDPKKIPILFVHGAMGTPKTWKYLAENIDRTRFQPWFFYYPTGARINSMSYFLFWKLFNLQVKYRFDTIYIAAHSMGGLVVRSFIMDYSKFFPYVKLFVSLATPWGGDKMAEYGVNQSPAVIPSWIDMQPDSEFIKSLYRTKMPETLSFYMFYGHSGNRNPFRSNNDGTITLSSLLDWRPQSEAKMCYAFNEDHASIALSKEVSAQFNTIINAFDKKDGAASDLSGGYLQLRSVSNNPNEDAATWYNLILRPNGKKGPETVVYLNANDFCKKLGPFPSGGYLASMVTLGAKAEPKSVEISIEDNKTRDLTFNFTADGLIYGYVTASLNQEDRPVGMPAERYLPMDKKVKISSITLKGTGVQRVLYPLQTEDFNYNDYFISREDFCFDGHFCFFGLPEGDYEIEITAQGYNSAVHKYHVTPGKQTDFRITELKPNS